jgi:hypothetical protein
VANDDQFLCLMVRIYPSSTVTNYLQVHHQFFMDGDNEPTTGRADLGWGAEMVVEDGYGFPKRFNHWSDGEVTGTQWAQAPEGVLSGYRYEARIARTVRDTQPEDVPPGSGNPARDSHEQDHFGFLVGGEPVVRASHLDSGIIVAVGHILDLEGWLSG